MEMLINGKTPIEIRDAHARCREGVCDGCAYYDHIDCETDLSRDTIDLINLYERQLNRKQALLLMMGVDDRG